MQRGKTTAFDRLGKLGGAIAFIWQRHETILNEQPIGQCENSDIS